MMKIQRRGVPRRRATTVAVFAFAVLLAPTAGHAAALGDDLVNVVLSPTPLPTSVDVVGTINDVISELDPTATPSVPVPDLETELPDAIGGVTGGGGGGGGAPENAGGPAPGQAPSAGDGSGTGDATSNGGANGSGGTGGATGRSTGAAGDGSAGGRDGEAAVVDEATPYGTVAVRGALAALGRARQIAGPLVPAVALAALALVGLAVMGRGSAGLVKLEDGARSRTFKL